MWGYVCWGALGVWLWVAEGGRGAEGAGAGALGDMSGAEQDWVKVVVLPLPASEWAGGGNGKGDRRFNVLGLEHLVCVGVGGGQFCCKVMPVGSFTGLGLGDWGFSLGCVWRPRWRVHTGPAAPRPFKGAACLLEPPRHHGGTL